MAKTFALPAEIAAALVVLILAPAGVSALAIASAEAQQQQQQLQHQREQLCCTPDQWEAGIGYVMVASPPYSSGYGHVAYDYTNQVLALNQTLLGADSTTEKFQQRLLLNGKSRKMYALDVTTGHCVTSDMFSGLPRQCVPPNFSYTSTITFGDASGQLSGLVFQANDGDQSITMVMTQNQCAPVFEMMRQGADQLFIGSFYNYTTGIKDRSVFNVPPGCKAAEGLEAAPSAGADADAVLMREFRSLREDAPCSSMFSPCWMGKRSQK